MEQAVQTSLGKADTALQEHQDISGKADLNDVLFPNFSNITPKKTFEYDVSDTSYHPLFTRANSNITDYSEIDDVVKFRITVTGSDIYARVDVVVRFQPALYPPAVMAWNDTYSGSAATTGINYMRIIYPKTLNSGYDWIVEYNHYNSTARHIKVEVFEDTESITWQKTKVATSYSSTYQSSSSQQLYTFRGLIANLGWRFVDGYARDANAANYLNSRLSIWLGGTSPLAGEALAANQLAIMSNQKAYKVTNKNVPIDCDCGVFQIGTTYAADAALGYNYVRQKISWTTLTGDAALTKDTFARGDQVYLRCTLGGDGKIYPDGHLSNVKSAGYTWVHIGTAQSATAINLDTCGKPFITLDSNGKMTHFNGIEIA